MLDLKHLKESGRDDSPPAISTPRIHTSVTPMMDAINLLEEIGKTLDSVLDPRHHKVIQHWDWGKLCKLDVEISQFLRRLKV